MSILRLTGVTREIGTFVILDGIDAAIALGDRIGLVGPNGAGKTTLLRLAAGRDEPSPALLALGLDPEVARTAVRFSFGDGATLAEADAASSALSAVLA